MMLKHYKNNEIVWISFTAILKQSHRNADTRRKCYNYISLSQGTISEFMRSFPYFSQKKGNSMKVCKLAEHQFCISQLKKVKNNNSFIQFIQFI